MGEGVAQIQVLKAPGPYAGTSPAKIGEGQAAHLWDENRCLRQELARLAGENVVLREEVMRLGDEVIAAEVELNNCEPHDPTAGHPEFHRLLAELGEMHSRKSFDYGQGGDPLANVRAAAAFGVRPWVASMVRANDKMTRIQNYAVTETLANEPVFDSLLDLASYALIAAVLFREEQGLGEKP